MATVTHNGVALSRDLFIPENDSDRIKAWELLQNHGKISTKNLKSAQKNVMELVDTVFGPGSFTKIAGEEPFILDVLNIFAKVSNTLIKDMKDMSEVMRTIEDTNRQIAETKANIRESLPEGVLE